MKTSPLFTLDEMFQLIKSNSRDNLFNNYDETLHRMSLLEGQGDKPNFNWLKNQSNPWGSSEHTVDHVLNLCRERLDRLPAVYDTIDWDDDFDIESVWNRFSLTTEVGLIVYGTGGFHRYLVAINGDVKFSEFHALESGIQKAKAMGFPTY